MDQIDRDAEFEERLLDQQIKKAATVKQQAESTGRCLNCNARLRGKARRWCDEDCRDDWQYRQGRAK